jgi:hypothetical protein
MAAVTVRDGSNHRDTGPDPPCSRERELWLRVNGSKKCSASAGWVQISVEDSGSGVDPARPPKLAENDPFEIRFLCFSR